MYQQLNKTENEIKLDTKRKSDEVDKTDATESSQSKKVKVYKIINFLNDSKFLYQIQTDDVVYVVPTIIKVEIVSDDENDIGKMPPPQIIPSARRM